jgi:hypothetical protein
VVRKGDAAMNKTSSKVAGAEIAYVTGAGSTRFPGTLVKVKMKILLVMNKKKKLSFI